jgi:hypothetical protein
MCVARTCARRAKQARQTEKSRRFEAQRKQGFVAKRTEPKVIKKGGK